MDVKPEIVGAIGPVKGPAFLYNSSPRSDTGNQELSKAPHPWFQDPPPDREA